MTENMNILIVEPGKSPRPTQIPNTLEAMEKVLGGAVQVGCFLPQRVFLISREKTEGLAPTVVCQIERDILAGHFCSVEYQRKKVKGVALCP